MKFIKYIKILIVKYQLSEIDINGKMEILSRHFLTSKIKNILCVGLSGKLIDIPQSARIVCLHNGIIENS